MDNTVQITCWQPYQHIGAIQITHNSIGTLAHWHIPHSPMDMEQGDDKLDTLLSAHRHISIFRMKASIPTG